MLRMTISPKSTPIRAELIHPAPRDATSTDQLVVDAEVIESRDATEAGEVDTEEPFAAVVASLQSDLPPILAKLAPVLAEYVPDTLLRKLIKLARAVARATQ